jgi:hypothetical protein
VPGHSQLSDSVESPVKRDVDCHHLPYQDGWAPGRTLGGGVLHRAVRARMLTH